MKLKSLSTILRAGALVALFVAGTSAVANAAPLVNFSTSGTFSGGPGVVILGGSGVQFTDAQGDNATLIFAGGGLQSIDSPSNIQFGTMLLGVTPIGNQFDGDIAGTNFMLTITQTAPSGGAANLSATVTGTLVKANQTDWVLQFAQTVAQIGNVVYTIGSGGQFGLVPPGEGQIAGTTTIQGNLKAVPEPTTMMLLGTGLLAAFRARRKSA